MSRLSHVVPEKHMKALYRLVSEIGTPREAEKVLEDLLTPQELEVIAERLQIVKLLLKGATQREVAAELGVSISKVTRGAHVLQYGTGALNKILK